MRDRIKKPPRRWWQVLCRTAVLVMAGLMAAYVTLPWWAPAEFLRKRLARDLTRQLGTEVRISKMSLSWSEGVEISGVTISYPTGFSPGPIATVEGISTEFSPLNLLLNRRLEWAELSKPRLFLRPNEQGELDLSGLGQMLGRSDSPGLDLRRISVREAVVTLELPASDRVLRLDISDLEFLAGRLHQLGRVTMSAALVQSGGSAPVGLNLSAGTGEHAVAAAASFSFSNIDLEQLPLVGLLDLPLRALSGRCSGSLDLQINHQGIVDRFSFNLVIRRLNVQPITGPTLPVIDKAGFRMDAAYDPITGELELHSASVRLPGVDLAGQATMFSEIRKGRWEAIKSLDVRGQIRPMQLAAMLTGRGVIGEDLTTEGPFDLRLTVSHEDSRPRVHLTVAGTSASIRRGRRILKPAGRKLSMALSGTFDRRNWQFSAEQGEFILGDNRFVVQGTLANVRRLVDRWSDRVAAVTARSLLEDISDLNLQGSLVLGELDSLRDLSPALADALSDVDLRGTITGRWFIDRGTAARVHAIFRIPADTHFSVGRKFVKQPDSPISIDLAATLDSAGTALKNVNVELACGGGRFRLDRGYLLLGSSQGGTEGATIEAGGRFDAEDIQGLLGGFGQVRTFAEHLKGIIDGEFSLHLAPGVRRGHLAADLTHLGVSIAPAWHKPPGASATALLDFLSDDAAPGDKRNTLTCELTLDHAQLDCRVVFPKVRLLSQQGAMTAHVELKDADGLAKHSPWLQDRLAGGKLGGSALIDADASWQDGQVRGRINCNADKLEFVSAATDGVRRIKKAGMPLRLKLAGRLRGRSGGGVVADLTSASLEIADSRLQLSSRAVMAQPARPADSTVAKTFIEKLRPAWLESLQADVDTSCVVDGPIGKLLPELADLVRRYGLAGRVKTAGRISAEGSSILLAWHVEANDFSAERIGPFPLHFQQADGQRRTFHLGPFAKPRDIPAGFDVEFSIASGSNELKINNVHVQIGDSGLLADGSIALAAGPTALPAVVGPVRGHIAVYTRRAQTLQEMLPLLRGGGLSGSAIAEMEFTSLERGTIHVPYARIKTNQLAGTFRGKDISLDGEILLERIDVVDGNITAVGGFKTETLEFAVGDNHGWLFAEVADLWKGPTGSFHLFCEKLDDKDLIDWLSPPAQDQPAPASRPHRLSGEAEESLRSRAEEIVGLVRAYLSSANLSGRVSIDRLSSFDASVGQSYDVRYLEMSVSVKARRAKVEYLTGLNGGTVRRGYEGNLDEDQPEVLFRTDISKVIAKENIQPHIDRVFPGNSVHGEFNHVEKVKISLRDLLAAAIDPRYKLHPVGTAKTVTTNGLIKGQGAPAFVTKLLPGLNTTEYAYDKMTAFAEFTPDGMAVNDMVFSGQTYDLYIEGTTDKDNIGRYEIGPILLGTPQSAEWNHTYRQGRIPVLKFKARIEGGKMYDVEVSYPWPNETLFTIFLRNNIFYRLWLSGRSDR